MFLPIFSHFRDPNFVSHWTPEVPYLLGDLEMPCRALVYASCITSWTILSRSQCPCCISDSLLDSASIIAAPGLILKLLGDVVVCCLACKVEVLSIQSCGLLMRKSEGSCSEMLEWPSTSLLSKDWQWKLTSCLLEQIESDWKVKWYMYMYIYVGRHFTHKEHCIQVVKIMWSLTVQRKKATTASPTASLWQPPVWDSSIFFLSCQWWGRSQGGCTCLHSKSCPQSSSALGAEWDVTVNNVQHMT